MLGGGGRSAHLQAEGRLIPGCLGQAAKALLGEGKEDPHLLPALCSRGLQMEQQKENHTTPA